MKDEFFGWWKVAIGELGSSLRLLLQNDFSLWGQAGHRALLKEPHLKKGRNGSAPTENIDAQVE